MPVKVGLKYIEIWKESMEDSVLAYEAEKPEKGKIVFYGPSNFTRWSARYGMTPLAEAVRGASGEACCINRGFGSTCPEHHLYYYDRMIRPLEPKVLVYSPGFGNGKAFGYTPEETFELAQRVVAYALTDFPELKIYILGINRNKDKREAAWEYDRWLREFAEATPRCSYLDITAWEPLARQDIYVADCVHYNYEGYCLYADFFKNALKDELAQF